MDDSGISIEDMEEEAATSSSLSTGSRRLVCQPQDLSVRELEEQERDGDLVLQPDFQRFYVFDNAKGSRLIESILMSVPLPVVYLAEEDDNKTSVIDGQQRLTTFFKFYRNDLRLSGLTILAEHNGKYFRDLPVEAQRIFQRCTIRCIVVKRESDKDVKFEIFERLNTGSVRLNDQELRNCVYRGRFNLLLRELASDAEWLRLLGRTQVDPRMIDREMILRFFALYLDGNQYQPPMKRFLNHAMETRREMSEAEAQRLRDIFRRTVLSIYSVFGDTNDKAFRRYEVGRDGSPDGKWGVGSRVNMALYDIIMTSCARYEQRELIPYGDSIRDALIDLMTTNREFNNAITLSTSARSEWLTRSNIWNNRLHETLSNPQSEPRLFTRAFKELLFEENPVCAICDQRIMSIDDAAVDHTLPYSLGGATTPANGRLAHRYCNSARGNRPEFDH